MVFIGLRLRLLTWKGADGRKTSGSSCGPETTLFGRLFFLQITTSRAGGALHVQW